MPSDSDALYRTMLASYAALAIGFPLTHIILVLYFLRLLVHKVYTPSPVRPSSLPSHIPSLLKDLFPKSRDLLQWPQRSDILSVFLPIGPLGQGSFAIMSLGQI